MGPIVWDHTSRRAASFIGVWSDKNARINDTPPIIDSAMENFWKEPFIGLLLMMGGHLCLLLTLMMNNSNHSQHLCHLLSTTCSPTKWGRGWAWVFWRIISLYAFLWIIQFLKYGCWGTMVFENLKLDNMSSNCQLTFFDNGDIFFLVWINEIFVWFPTISNERKF